MLTRIGSLCGLLVALIAIFAQIGWVKHSIALVQISSDFSPMQFNTAFCFLLCGINLIFFNSSFWLFRTTGLIAAIFAAVTASQYFLKTSYGIDSLFIQPFTQSNTEFIGRMSLNSAINFIIMGSLLFVSSNFKNHARLRIAVIIMVSILMALAIVPLLAYLSGIQTAYPWNNLTGMAVHTAFSFIFLGLGLICQLWASAKGTPYFLVVPVVMCLITASFSISGAIHTYEDLKYQELMQEEAYYRSQKVAIGVPAFNSHFIHRKSSYISYFVLFFSLMTSLLITLTAYFHLKSRQNAEALKKSEERLQLAVTGTTDGLFDWDVATGEFYHSTRFETVLGYDKESLTPEFTTFLELIHPDDKETFQAAVREHFKLKSPVNLDIRLKNSSNEYLWFNFRGTPTCDGSGEGMRMTGFITDVSERYAIDKMKDEFISTVSHELRTPMTSINGSLALILSGQIGECQGKIKEFLQIAERNCSRLLRLINDILDIEKITTGQFQFNLSVCDLDKIIGEAIATNQMYAEEYNVKLSFKPEANVNVYADPDRLMQVLANLISNAIKFSRSGGEVIVTMQTSIDNIRVSVTDQGIGIPDEFRSRIFQKFSQADSSATREKKGTGLGLNITKSIIEKLGGDLDFTSVPNQGTTFYFDLPILQNKSL